jgi:hypothetical protein
MLREMRAKKAIERELAKEAYERSVSAHTVELRPHWTERGIGRVIYATGIVIGLMLQGIVLLMKGAVDIYRAKPSGTPTRKEFKGVAGQIDELENSPFITSNAIVSKKRRR